MSKIDKMQRVDFAELIQLLNCNKVDYVCQCDDEGYDYWIVDVQTGEDVAHGESHIERKWTRENKDARVVFLSQQGMLNDFLKYYRKCQRPAEPNIPIDLQYKNTDTVGEL